MPAELVHVCVRCTSTKSVCKHCNAGHSSVQHIVNAAACLDGRASVCWVDSEPGQSEGQPRARQNRPASKHICVSGLVKYKQGLYLSAVQRLSAHHPVYSTAGCRQVYLERSNCRVWQDQVARHDDAEQRSRDGNRVDYAPAGDVHPHPAARCAAANAW